MHLKRLRRGHGGRQAGKYNTRRRRGGKHILDTHKTRRYERNWQTITLSIGRDNRVIINSQVTDYQFRGTELELYNVYDFVWDTYEGKMDSATGENEDEANEPTPQQGHQLRSAYLDPHPNRFTKCRIVRSPEHNSIPMFVGRFLPRRSEQDLYYASVLVLLKPWRNLHELAPAPGQTWRAQYEEFLHGANAFTRRLVDNLDHRYECEDAAAQLHDDEGPLSGGAGSDYAGESEEEDAEEDSSARRPLPSGNNNVTDEDLVEAREQIRSEKFNVPYANDAIAIGDMAGAFDSTVRAIRQTATVALPSDLERLRNWQDQLSRESPSVADVDAMGEREGEGGSVQRIEMEAHPSVIMQQPMVEAALGAEEPANLLEDQRRAYEIVTTHLDDYLAGKNPDQLLMILHGEGGTGKSLVLQTITKYFEAQSQANTLAKGAYTGIAASLIEGRTLHTLARIGINGSTSLSDKAKQNLETTWRDVRYLIVDEVSMVDRALLATLSRRLSLAKTGSSDSDLPFGGINVILCGDLHQFPPVARKKRAPLYVTADRALDSEDECIGRSIWEEFTIVVQLSQQVRATDPVWQDFLRHLRYGEVQAHHIEMVEKLVLTHPDCPETNFRDKPWCTAVLVTPRHSVRVRWNEAALMKHCEDHGVQLFKGPAADTTHRRPLTNAEQMKVINRNVKGNGRSHQLPDSVNLAVGMKAMVTLNVHTDLDVTNGARGEVVGIVLGKDEPDFTQDRVVRLRFPPAYVLFKLDRTRLRPLPGLEESVIPIVPATCTFTVDKMSVARSQLPMTEAYAFTDYRAQGQTIANVIVDIAKPTGFELTLANVYVALSRSSGRSTIRILRPFDARVLLQPLDEHLQLEDMRLEHLHRRTKEWWERSKNE